MFLYAVISLVVGIALWYFVFYFRYKHRNTVDELRWNLNEANKEIEYLSGELEEFVQQNAILKQKTSELLEKNDDLSDVVSELSKYYVHLKKAAEKTSELTKFLQSPSQSMEERIQHYANKEEEIDQTQKFF
mgnify:CR=1 FL=1